VNLTTRLPSPSGGSRDKACRGFTLQRHRSSVNARSRLLRTHPGVPSNSQRFLRTALRRAFVRILQLTRTYAPQPFRTPVGARRLADRRASACLSAVSNPPPSKRALSGFSTNRTVWLFLAGSVHPAWLSLWSSLVPLTTAPARPGSWLPGHPDALAVIIDLRSPRRVHSSAPAK
jgi:hypothetical protein